MQVFDYVRDIQLLTTPAVTIEKLPGKNVFLIEQNGDFHVIDTEDPAAVFENTEPYEVLFVTDNRTMVIQEKGKKVYVVEGEEKVFLGKVGGPILYIQELADGFIYGSSDDPNRVHIFFLFP